MVTIIRRLTKEFAGFVKVKSNFIPIAMAWRSIGADNTDLINQLEDFNIVKSRKVKELMIEADRKYYCTRTPYAGAPQSIGNGVTIGAPHMHAYALELLIEKLKNCGKALDVGSKSGYLTACLARANRKASSSTSIYEKFVIVIEHQPELEELAIKNVYADDSSFIKNNE